MTKQGPGPSSCASGLASWVLIVVLASAFGCEGASESGGKSGSQGDSEIISLVGEPIPDSLGLVEVLQHPDAFERARRVAEILQRTPPEDLEDVQHAFRTAALDQGDIEYALFGEWWARFDPETAFGYANHDLRMESPRVILSVVRTWARVDPLGAIESKRLQDQDRHMPALRGDLVEALVAGWFHSDQAGLEEWIQSLPVGETDHTAALRTYARQRLLRDGFVETLEWTQNSGFPKDDERILLAGALSVVAHQNPELAVEWLAIAEENGVDTRTFVPRIVLSWGHHHPREALAYALENTEELERNRALLNVAKRWVRRDEEDMSAWLDSQGEGEWQDILRVQYVRATVRNHNYRVDWKQLADRTQRIFSERKRLNMTGWVLSRWFVIEPVAAEAWVNEHPDAIDPERLDKARKLSPRDIEEIEKAMSAVSREAA